MDKLLQEFAAVGIAQALPGLRRMRAVTLAAMDAEIVKLQALLEQVGGISPAPAQGRPKKQSQAIQAAIAAAENGHGSKSKGYWAKFTPEERAAEMRRRIARRKSPGEPLMIAGKYTTAGVVKELGGTSKLLIRRWADSAGIGKAIPVTGLSGLGRRTVFTASELEKLRRHFAPKGDV